MRGTRIPASMVRTIAARGRSPAASGRRSSRWQSPGASPSATIGASKALFEACEASVRETNSGRRGVSRQSLEFSLPATPGATKVLTVASEAGARETNPGRCGVSRPLLGGTLHSQHLALPKRLHSEQPFFLSTPFLACVLLQASGLAIALPVGVAPHHISNHPNPILTLP